MRYTVKINRQASRDLTEIFKYIEDREKSAAPAERLTNALVDSALGLAQFPYRGRPGHKADTRELVFPRVPFLAVYRVREDVIEVLRILHGAQRWP